MKKHNYTEVATMAQKSFIFYKNISDPILNNSAINKNESL